MIYKLKNFDRILFGFLLGVAFPFSLCLISIIIWFLIDRRESAVFLYLIPALLLGLLININFLKIG